MTTYSVTILCKFLFQVKITTLSYMKYEIYISIFINNIKKKKESPLILLFVCLWLDIYKHLTKTGS